MMLTSINVPDKLGGSKGVYSLALYEELNSIGVYIQRCPSKMKTFTKPDGFWGCIEVDGKTRDMWPVKDLARNMTRVYADKLKRLPPPMNKVECISKSDYLMKNSTLAKSYCTDYLSTLVTFLSQLKTDPSLLLQP
jgi:hypothetical protein